MTTFPRVQDFLRKCNLLEYYDRFISEGFDQLQSLLDVTESDLIAMDVKRGHRRRLQREIATMKGIPPNVPLYIQYGSGLEDSSDHSTLPINNVTPPKILYVDKSQSSNEGSQSRRREDQPDPSESGGVKRKYKRHPKRDKNAPMKPLSAYVMFAHKVREEYAGRNIPFPDMAKIVGDRWKNVSPEVKEAIENEAAKKKEEYQAAMAVYKTTDEWKKYQEYLKEFKEKYDSTARDSSKRKRHKGSDKSENSPDSDNTTPSGYSSTRSTSVGYDNGGNTSSGSGNGNGNGHNNDHPRLSYSNNYIPPYLHNNPTVPYGYKSNTILNDSSGKNTGGTFLTPPSSINTNNNDAPSTILADLYAKDDSNAGDDQSQPGNGSSSGNGISSFSGSSSSSRREDSTTSTTSSSNSTPPAVFMETDDNLRSQRQSFQNQNKHQHQSQQDISQSHQQEDATKK